jgi:hypothetical protein
VKAGEVLAVVHARRAGDVPSARIRGAFEIGDAPPITQPLVLGRIDASG